MKGILFKPEMIQAIVEGRKTQTRRVLKPQPIYREGKYHPDNSLYAYYEWSHNIHWFAHNLPDESGIEQYAPYRIGETVYIKEKALYWVSPIVEGIQYDKPSDWWTNCAYQDDPEIEGLLADNKLLHLERTVNKLVEGNPIIGKWEWKSSMFMPAHYARYFIVITDVRAERLSLPLSTKELELEGGEEALAILKNLNGKWVWVYSFKLKA